MWVISRRRELTLQDCVRCSIRNLWSARLEKAASALLEKNFSRSALTKSFVRWRWICLSAAYSSSEWEMRSKWPLQHTRPCTSPRWLSPWGSNCRRNMARQTWRSRFRSWKPRRRNSRTKWSSSRARLRLSRQGPVKDAKMNRRSAPMNSSSSTTKAIISKSSSDLSSRGELSQKYRW